MIHLHPDATHPVRQAGVDWTATTTQFAPVSVGAFALVAVEADGYDSESDTGQLNAIMVMDGQLPPLSQLRDAAPGCAHQRRTLPFDGHKRT